MELALDREGEFAILNFNSTSHFESLSLTYFFYAETLHLVTFMIIFYMSVLNGWSMTALFYFLTP